MRGLVSENAVDAASAYLAWWQLAGVDCAMGEQPVDWLRPLPTAGRATSSPPSPAAEISHTHRPATLPTTLDAFRAWLAQDAEQPEKRWPGGMILPEGPVNAPLMVITDMPDPADVAAGALFSDKAGRLLDAMLRVMGFGRGDIYLASLFHSRPPGAMVEAADLAAAASRMRAHVMLASPRNLLLLGDRTIRTLLPESEAPATGNGLRLFNHDGGTLPVFATFHPRLLLGQPAAKAECWRTLQNLIEEMTE